MGEGRGVRGVIRRRQTKHIIEKQDRDSTVVNEDGILIPEMEEDQYVYLHHQPISDEVLDEAGAQRSKNDKKGWSLIEQAIKNEDVIHINGFKFTVKEIQDYQTHSEFMLVRTGEKNNRVE